MRFEIGDLVKYCREEKCFGIIIDEEQCWYKVNWIIVPNLNAKFWYHKDELTEA